LRDVGIPADNGYELCAQLRDLPDNLCLAGHVRAKALPVVLAAYGPDMIFYRLPDHCPVPKDLRVCEAPGALRADLVRAIRDWRQRLREELDYIGFAISRDDSGEFRVSHALRRRRRESDLLGDRVTPKGLSAAGYYLVGADVLDEVPAYAALEDLLNTFRPRAAAEGVKEETLFQRFFELYPHMLQGQSFEEAHAKVRLPRKEGKHYEPDFLMRSRPSDLHVQRHGVLDLKRPDVPLLVGQRRFHRRLSSEIHAAVTQLHDYSHEIRRPSTRASQRHVLQALGEIPRRPRKIVVIGRSPRSSDDRQLLASRIEESLAPVGVQVLSYDDLLDDEGRRLMLQITLSSERD